MVPDGVTHNQKWILEVTKKRLHIPGAQGGGHLDCLADHLHPLNAWLVVLPIERVLPGDRVDERRGVRSHIQVVQLSALCDPDNQ